MEQNGIVLKVLKHEDDLVGFVSSNIPIDGLFAGCKSNIAFQIIIDTSGSMSRYFENIRRSLIEFIQFIGSGVQYLPSGVNIYLNIIHFDAFHKQVFPKFETELDYGFGCINANTYKQVEQYFPRIATGYTYMYSALKTCNEHIWSKLPINTVLKKILLTDGEPNDPDPKNKTGFHSEIWAKQQISSTFIKCIDQIVAIGRAGQYDYNFLKNITNTDPAVAMSSIEILDNIRLAFFDIASKDFPDKCLLSLHKKYIEQPDCDVISWTETDNSYQLNLDQIGFGYYTTFTFKTKLDKIPFRLDYQYNGPNSWIDVIPVKEPSILELHQINIYKTKKKIKNLKNNDSHNSDQSEEEFEERIKYLKEMERQIILYMADPAITHNEIIQNEWQEQLSTVLQLQNFLTSYDENSYNLYANTRTTSHYNTSILRTMSSQPLNRLPSKIDGPVEYFCTICMDTIEQDEIILYNCFHMFCLGCAVLHYISGGKDCPKCRHGNVVNPTKIKKPVFPIDPTGEKKCLTNNCANRFHGFNYPCMHVTSCQPCGNTLKNSICPSPNCGHTVQKYIYYYTDYDTVT